MASEATSASALWIQVLKDAAAAAVSNKKKSSAPRDDNLIRDLARKGIPDDVRGQVWQFLCNAQSTNNSANNNTSNGINGNSSNGITTSNGSSSSLTSLTSSSSSCSGDVLRSKYYEYL